MTPLPAIRVLAMGGTIAGSAATSTDTTGYRAGSTGIDEVLSSVPLTHIARVSGEQFAQIDSSDLTDGLLLALARRITELAADPDVDAIVITHGTDTLEETAYLLHLSVRTPKPIVLVGSMRPPTALSPDGPMNIFAAVAVAASPLARDKGVLVVMNDEIHTARDVTKSSSLRVDAFESPYGPLGIVTNGVPTFYRAVARPVLEPFAVPSELPSSTIVFAHSGLDAAAITPHEVIVFAGFGNGTVPARVIDALDSSGALVVRATRTGSGHVTLVGASDPRANAWIAVDDQNPQRARILACLALGVTRDPVELQRIFHAY
jgi:glutamin-(asparagin-)ase